MGSTSYTGNMFSLRLGLFLCIFYIIGMEAAPEPKPEDLHIHLNLHDPTGAAKQGVGVAQAAGDYGHGAGDYSLDGTKICRYRCRDRNCKRRCKTCTKKCRK